MRNTKLVALAGLITGIAASFSMAASEYLSTKSEGTEKNPLKSSLYTGTAYIITVMCLIFPFLVFKNYLFCLALTIVFALLIISIFTFYISVARDLSFRKRFMEMASISLGVALLSFGIGWVIRLFLDIDI
jgi:VIT1/CCC1 family predicted Fe2+/Mn2+ transporter